MRNIFALAFALLCGSLSGCAIGHRIETTPLAPPPDYRSYCERYVEGFERFYTIDARIKKTPIPDPALARELVAYLKGRPRRSDNDRTARNRALRVLKNAERGQPKLAETVNEFLVLSRECDYANVPYGWTVAVENQKRYGFNSFEKGDLRSEVLLYLRDEDSIAVDLSSVSIRVNLADAAVKAKFLKLKKPMKRKLSNLKDEIGSILEVSRPLTAMEPESRAKSTVADVKRAAKFLKRLRAILPAK